MGNKRVSQNMAQKTLGILGVPKSRVLSGSQKKDCSILVSILGSPGLCKLPYGDCKKAFGTPV